MSLYQKLPLGDVLQISSERIDPLNFADRSFNFIGLENIESQTGRILKAGPTPGSEIQSTKNVFHPGQILYGKLRPYLNKVYLAEKGGICSTDIFVLSCDKNRVTAKFVAYCLRSETVLETVKNLTVGANLPRVDAKGFLSIEIPVPSLSEQERIAQILDEGDALCRLRVKADDKARAIFESLYLRTFWQHNAQSPWKMKTVDELAAKRDGAIRTGPFGSQLLHSEFVDTGVPALGIDNVVANRFRWVSQRYITQEKYKQFERFRVFPGDVLVTIMGTVGRSCIAPDDLPICMSTKHLCVITPDRAQLHPSYLWAALLFDPGVRQQTRAVGNGAIMEGWNSTIIRQLKIYVPPVALQEKFAVLVSEIAAVQAAQAVSRQQLEDLFESLLYRAFQEQL